MGIWKFTLPDVNMALSAVPSRCLCFGAGQAAKDMSEDLDIAEIGALAAEVASSGGNSIFGDSDSLSDLAKEVQTS